MSGEYPQSTNPVTTLEVAQAAAVLIGVLRSSPNIGADTKPGHSVYGDLYRQDGSSRQDESSQPELVISVGDPIASVDKSKKQPQPHKHGRGVAALAAIVTLGLAGGVAYTINNPGIFSFASHNEKDKPVPDIDPYTVLPIDVMKGVNHYDPLTIRLVELGNVSVPVVYNYHPTKAEIAKAKKKGEAMMVTDTFNLDRDAKGNLFTASNTTAAEGIFVYNGTGNQKPFTYKKTEKGYDIEIDASLWTVKAQLGFNQGNIWPNDEDSFSYPRLKDNPLPDGKHDLPAGEADRVWNLLKDKGDATGVMSDSLAAGTYEQLMAGSLADLEEGKSANQNKSGIDAVAKQSMRFFIIEAGKAIGVDFNVTFKAGTTFSSNFLQDLIDTNPDYYKTATETKVFTTKTQQVTVTVDPTYDDQGLRIGRQ